jgi:16S rRNA (adenine1518-N6/adenine1519-N6)-dimethyltransferase
MNNHFHHLKALGQHFLRSDDTALQIVQALQPLHLADNILEIGPGLGVLTQHLKKIPGKTLFLSEMDRRIISKLKTEDHFPENQILEGDFLKMPLQQYINGPFLLIGNFPYNISSQILFKMLDHLDLVPLMVGMFQKEMALRVVAKHGNKDYGVISVLVQLYYDCEYLFELPPEAFDPPPKVFSSVIRLTRKTGDTTFNPKLIKQVVKAGFNQRRKKLSNALASVPGAKDAAIALNFADKRAEQLSVADFILLSNQIEQV